MHVIFPMRIHSTYKAGRSACAVYQAHGFAFLLRCCCGSWTTFWEMGTESGTKPRWTAKFTTFIKKSIFSITRFSDRAGVLSYWQQDFPRRLNLLSCSWSPSGVPISSEKVDHPVLAAFRVFCWASAEPVWMAFRSTFFLHHFSSNQLKRQSIWALETLRLEGRLLF